MLAILCSRQRASWMVMAFRRLVRRSSIILAGRSIEISSRAFVRLCSESSRDLFVAHRLTRRVVERTGNSDNSPNVPEPFDRIEQRVWRCCHSHRIPVTGGNVTNHTGRCAGLLFAQC